VKLDPKKQDCRRALVRLYNLGLADKIPPSKATRLAYIVGIILKSIENDEQRWASSESVPDPATIAAGIRECMRMGDSLIPGPPGGGDDGQ
jgi:hypothetical protein